MSKNPLGLALVGAGAFGRFCLDVYAAMPEIRIVAIVDSDLHNAASIAELYDAQAFSDLDAVFGMTDVEVVALNTPPFLHASQGLAMLKAGKHLFCEKPLALTLDNGRSMIKTASQHSVLLTVNYVMRQNPFWQLAVGLRKSGILGSLRHMSLMNHAAGLALPKDHWFWNKEKSGGIWIEHGVHFFDAFAWVAGGTGTIACAQPFTRLDGAVDRVEALAHFGDVGAHFYHAFDQSPQTEQTTVKLSFEKGYVTLYEWIPTKMIVETSVDLDSLQHQIVQQQTDAQVAIEAGTLSVTVNADKTTIYRRAIERGMHNFVEAIRSGNPTSIISGDQALESLRLALDADKYTV